MKYKHIAVIVYFFSSLTSYAQTVEEYVSHYGNGNIKEKGSFIRENEVEVYPHNTITRYYKNGNIRSVEKFDKGFPIDTSLYYYKNGTCKQRRIDIDKEYGYFETFYSNSNLRSRGKLFYDQNIGIIPRYNRKKILVEHIHFFKGKNVKVSNTLKKNNPLTKELADQIKYSSAILTRKNSLKTCKINKGAMIGLNLNGDTETNYLFQVEGFTANTMIVSEYVYDTTDSKDLLQYKTSSQINFSDIDNLYFSVNHRAGADLAAFITSICGVELLTNPIIIPYLASSIIPWENPLGLAISATGIPVTYLGSKLRRRLIFYEYDIESAQFK